MALSVLMIGSTLAACNGGGGAGGGLKGDGGDKALNIRVWDGGYGTDWAYAVAEEFEKEYDIEVNVKGSSLRNQLSAEMQTAEYKNQQFDLYFTDITPDASSWENKAMARYYGKESVVRKAE